jgi:hypothetical protein
MFLGRRRRLPSFRENSLPVKCFLKPLHARAQFPYFAFKAAGIGGIHGISL